MLGLSYPSLILQVHEGRVKDALRKAEQARLMREAQSAAGTDELVLRHLFLKLWDSGRSLVNADHIQLTWHGRPGH